MDHKLTLKAEFIKSSSHFNECPDTNVPEIAFIGRSNVGKSSLINMVVGHKSLAKTSGTPGKTQLINHFKIEDKWNLVDLPGYGYAKVSKVLRNQFKGIIYNYLENREQLTCTMVLIDSRHPPQQLDVDFINWMGKQGLPFYIIFTKCDKLGKEKLAVTMENYQNELFKVWEELPPMFLSSATNKLGREEILDAVDEIIEAW